ncbi:MAG: HyaD/HybD family hydrogenase maturation endopeptidase [Selenomonadaceae bacterium]|nr:HyaD/HybD family hydrogenase maturation endopeptidase [Selenomonadaceae bacterium]MBQ3727291.1 HyaD/HybD family hydrogenase maturation endopeptidase [Selenomonadaceae bacterium]
MESLFVTENTVLGIGNIILSDEGFGVRVVEYLEKNFRFPENVSLLDGGTLGVELTHFITGTRRLLIIDSIDGGAEGGKIFHLRGEEIKNHFAQKISAHEVGIQDVLTMLELSGKKIPCVELIGAQPFSLEAGVELTAQMKKLVPLFADKAVEILKSWGVEVQR